MRRRAVPILLALVGIAPLAACARPGATAALPSPGPVFDPATFFVGRTEGSGTLARRWHDPEAVSVSGTGELLVDGTLVLRQRVSRTGHPDRRRLWRLRPTGVPGEYRGHMSDATDLVTARVTGNRLTIAYPMRGGFTAVQQIDLAADGQSAVNRMTVTLRGLRVATLDEVIRRVGPTR
ncbi:DUF3833 family protein [Sphingomonas changnyeongensis]|uniref:DUF3833 family protein n=1 Tax=Sphingomonas changnyeongensis TaxID=2698679 RepID=A0A7Z2S9Z2_9SPHN|nr:DUF3833 family protein [Sphingomonas changnyeongensis]QHL91304.1 DUF3833 family protein [Sphingomonas changnyeongensis]